MIKISQKLYWFLFVAVFIIIVLSITLNALLFNVNPTETLLILIPALSGWFFKTPEPKA